MLAESDEILMRNYCDGDLVAFKELYRRHQAGLYRFISWRSPRKDWVAEIVQDAWAALHAARARYTPIAGFKTYLYQIARNRLIDLLRQRESTLGCQLAYDEEDNPPFDQQTESMMDVRSPELELDKKQRIVTLHNAIKLLPIDQKETLVLQQFNGMSLDEIAAITEVSIETVKSRLRYAMSKLRTHLQNQTVQAEAA